MTFIPDDLHARLRAFLSRIVGSCAACRRRDSAFCRPCDLAQAFALKSVLEANTLTHSRGERLPPGFYREYVRRSLVELGGGPSGNFVATRRIRLAGKPLPSYVYHRMIDDFELESRPIRSSDDLGVLPRRGRASFAVRLLRLS